MMHWTVIVFVLGIWGHSSEATFHRRLQPSQTVYGYPAAQPLVQYNMPPVQRYITLNDKLYAVLGETVQYVPAAPPATVYSAPAAGPAFLNAPEPNNNDNAPSVNSVQVPAQDEPSAQQTPAASAVLPNSAAVAGAAANSSADVDNLLTKTDDPPSQSVTDNVAPSAPYSSPEPPSQTVPAPSALPNSFDTVATPTATPASVTPEPVNTYTAPPAPAHTLTDQSNVQQSSAGVYAAQPAPPFTNVGLDVHWAPSEPPVPPPQAGIAASPPLGPVVYAAGSGGPPSADQRLVFTVSNPRITVTRKLTKYTLRHPPIPYTQPVTVVFSNRDEKSLPSEGGEGVPFTVSSVAGPSLMHNAPILVKNQDEFGHSHNLLGSSGVTSQSNLGLEAATGNYPVQPDSSTSSVYNTPQTTNGVQQSQYLISYTLAQQPLLKLYIDPATHKTFFVNADGHPIELNSPGSGVSSSSPYSTSAQPQDTGLQFYGAANGLQVHGATLSNSNIKENLKINDMIGLNGLYGTNNLASLTTPRSGNAGMPPTTSDTITAATHNALGYNQRLVQSQQPRDAETLSRLPALFKPTYQRLDESGQADRPLLTLPGYGST
ncbi:Peroxisomal bifunctional enzyme [Frankliniella fusca]|uniref:Peroxisomal bifunctional enzyme n=1 Tax=Frankliniella fusca TaxID=407009 RepID=A0AAE1H9P2_9NEOP|nr:Peroxisomal bifunctional enzyme [Frankliniella fusca]